MSWVVDSGEGTEWLTARSDHSQAVVLKISEAIGAPLNELHFPMEAFGNAIVFSKPPRGGNFDVANREMLDDKCIIVQAREAGCAGQGSQMSI